MFVRYFQVSFSRGAGHAGWQRPANHRTRAGLSAGSRRPGCPVCRQTPPQSRHRAGVACIAVTSTPSQTPRRLLSAGDLQHLSRAERPGSWWWPASGSGRSDNAHDEDGRKTLWTPAPDGGHGHSAVRWLSPVVKPHQRWWSPRVTSTCAFMSAVASR